MSSDPCPVVPEKSIEVLHVDDDSEFLSLTEAMIGQLADISVTTVTDPETVTAELTDAIDCIVSDYDMPDCNGIDLLKEVRAVRPNIPFILFTGRGGEEVASEAISGGVTDYIQKDGSSDTFERLVNRIKKAVEHYQTEQQLAHESSLLDTIFEQIPYHMYVKDADRRVLRVSNAHVEDPSEIIGKRDEEVYTESFAERTAEDDRRVIEEGEPILLEEEFIGEQQGKGYSYEHIQNLYEEDLVTDKSRYDEWVLTSKVPWRDEDGNVVGLIGITLDISDRKHYEQSLENQTARLEEFIAQVAGDIQSPLQRASGIVTRIQTDQAPDEPLLDDLTQSLDRITAVVEDLFEFGEYGVREPDVEPVDMASLVQKVWERCTVNGAQLNTDDLDTVTADPAQLQCLLNNLIENALRHGESDTTVTIGSLSDGFYVADDGPGIPAAIRNKVSQPGYTTDGGPGFGLAIVEAIARRHGWAMDITESSEGGTRIEVLF